MTKTVYPLVAGALPTILVSSFNPLTDTQITVESIGYIPIPTNHLTIRSNPHFVTIQYTEIEDNVIKGITFVEGEVNYTFPVGSTVMRTIDKYDIDALNENKVSTYQGTEHSGELLVVGSDGNITASPVGGTVSFSSISGSPYDNENLTQALDGKVTLRDGYMEMGEDANGTYIWT